MDTESIVDESGASSSTAEADLVDEPLLDARASSSSSGEGGFGFDFDADEDTFRRIKDDDDDEESLGAGLEEPA